MTNIQRTFAGFDLEKVVKDEDARRAEEQRVRELEARRKVADAGKRGTAPVPATPSQPASPLSVASYTNFTFEHPAYREAGATEKKLLHYDESLARLRAAGYERHARPQEVFSLLINGLEGKLTGASQPLAAVKNDILTGYEEWLNLAFERKGAVLVAYLDPEGLVWRKDKYKKDNFTFAEKREFTIGAVESCKWLKLQNFPTTLVEYLYTRPFDKLPKDIQDNGVLYLPSEKTLWPVGRGDYGFGVGASYDWASRGVRGAAPKNKP